MEQININLNKLAKNGWHINDCKCKMQCYYCKVNTNIAPNDLINCTDEIEEHFNNLHTVNCSRGITNKTLSKYNLHYISNQQTIVCYHCNYEQKINNANISEILAWESSKKHKLQNPNCESNHPIYESVIHQASDVMSITDSIYANSENRYSSFVCAINNVVPLDNSRVSHKEMEMEISENRYLRFLHLFDQLNALWPDGKGGNQALEISKSGYVPVCHQNYKPDAVICYFCELMVDNWEDAKDPWLIHAKQSQNCRFLQYYKSADYINNAQNPFQQTATPKPDPCTIKETPSTAEGGVARTTTNFSIHLERFKSFSTDDKPRWKGTHQTSANMAEAGFFNQNLSNDSVKCYKCGVIAKGWTHEIPLEKHYLLNKDCPHLRNISIHYSTYIRRLKTFDLENIKNIEQCKEITNENISNMANAGFFCIQHQNHYVRCFYCGFSDHIARIFKRPLSTHAQNPNYSHCAHLIHKSYEYETKHARMLSFNRCPSKDRYFPGIEQTSENMAEAGFYWLYDDFARCFSCELTVSQWEASDIPINEHNRHNPRCTFIITKTCKFYASYNNRVFSFTHINSANWPFKGTEQTKENMASNGFFYYGTKASPDSVKCFKCNTIVRCWQQDDTPRGKHLIFSKDCSFVKSLDNLQLESLPYRETQPEYQTINLDDINHTITIKPHHLPYSDLVSRINSYPHERIWKTQHCSNQDIKSLARCGFYYYDNESTEVSETGQQRFDEVICFACGVRLHYWDPDDSPISEHFRLLHNCPYINKIKDWSKEQSIVLNFLHVSETLGYKPKDIIMAFMHAFLVSRLSLKEINENAMITAMQAVQVNSISNENENTTESNTEDEDKICTICLDREANRKYSACGHGACKKCTITIRENNNLCPLCREPIKLLDRI